MIEKQIADIKIFHTPEGYFVEADIFGDTERMVYYPKINTLDVCISGAIERLSQRLKHFEACHKNKLNAFTGRPLNMERENGND